MISTAITPGPFTPKIQVFRAVNSVNSLVIVRKTLSPQKSIDPFKTVSNSCIGYFSNSHFQGRFISTMVLIKEHGTAKQNALVGLILRYLIVINYP